MKKGFVFIETIVTVVILCGALIYLHSSYNNIINNEEERVYYDDTAYIYRTYYIREFLLNNSTIEKVKTTAFNNIYVTQLSHEYGGLFTNDNDKINFASIYSYFNISHVYLISQKMINECEGPGIDTDEVCKNSYEILSYNTRNYVKSLNTTTHDYLLVIEYAEKISENIEDEGAIISCVWGTDTNCHSYFTSLGV